MKIKSREALGYNSKKGEITKSMRDTSRHEHEARKGREQVRHQAQRAHEHVEHVI